MAKKVELGNFNPVISNINIYKYNDKDEKEKVFSSTDKYKGLVLEMDIQELCDALANAATGTREDPVPMSEFVKKALSQYEDEDDFFNVAAVALEPCVRSLRGPEKLVLQAAMMYCKQIAKGEF